MADPIRLQKYFTDCGILSRRAAENEIVAGHVKINGVTAQLGDKIDPDCDRVEWNGKPIQPRAEQAAVYLMLNKPRGYVTTSKDEKDRKKVTDLVRDVKTRVYPVGRLDMDSEGLLLLTNDGEFTNRLTHPRHEIPKIYTVTVSPIPTKAQIFALSQPMEIDGYRLRPVEVQTISQSELKMFLYEGRNRQIRKMCAAVGLKVTKLRRIAIGALSLGDLPIGKWRHLTEEEVQYLLTNNNQNLSPKG